MIVALKIVVFLVLGVAVIWFFVTVNWNPRTADNAIHKNYYVIGLLLVIALAAVGLWAIIKF